MSTILPPPPPPLPPPGECCGENVKSTISPMLQLLSASRSPATVDGCCCCCWFWHALINVGERVWGDDASGLCSWQQAAVVVEHRINKAIMTNKEQGVRDQTSTRNNKYTKEMIEHASHNTWTQTYVHTTRRTHTNK